jgi:hypothetical protein
MEKKYDVPIHIRLERTQAVELDAFCKAAKMSRSQVFRELLRTATLRPAIIRSEAPATNGERELVK